MNKNKNFEDLKLEHPLDRWYQLNNRRKALALLKKVKTNDGISESWLTATN